MSDHPLINLLIIDNSLANVERITQILRGAGYVIEVLHTEKASEVKDSIKYKTLDLIMLRIATELPPLERIREYIDTSQQDIPLLAMLDDKDPEIWLSALQTGADNVFVFTEADHLELVFEKEINNLHTRRQLKSFKTRLNETEGRSRTLTDNSHDAIAYIHEGIHIYANPAYLNLFGYANAEDLESKTLLSMIVRSDQDKMKRVLRDVMRSGQSGEPVALTGSHSSGEEIPLTLQCIPTRINSEPCIQIVIHPAAMSREKQAEYQALQDKNQELERKINAFERQIKEFANQDDLTRLYNRRYFIDYVDSVCSDSVARGGFLLYILLNDFRGVSESIGFHGAEQLLSDIAKVLRKHIDKQDILAHFTDAVFTLYTPQTDTDTVIQAATRITGAIKDHASSGGKRLITTTCSIGICQLKDYHKNAAQALSQADRACEIARQRGSNQVVVYRPDAGTGGDAGEEAKIELLLDALSSNRLKLLFQPIASFQSADQQRYKAYIQILDSQKKPLRLADIAPVAESRGVMTKIDYWLLEACIAALPTVNVKKGAALVSLFLRISNNSLNDDFYNWLSQKVKQARLPEDALVIEIAEDTVEAFFDESKRMRDRLNGIGIGFAISHFGGKENSERILKHVRPDYIKLDIEIIERLSKDEDSRQAMIDLTELSKQLGFQVIASDINSAPQMANIWQYGVTLVQGDMIQEPSPQMNFNFKEFMG